MEQSYSWEVKSHSTSQKIPTFYGIRGIITVFTKARQWTLSLDQLNPVRPIDLYLPKVQLNVILPPTLPATVYSVYYQLSSII
jgi:hypothetical protein